MEKYIIFAGAFVITAILMMLGKPWLDKKFNKKPKPEKIPNVLRQSKVYLYLGISGVILWPLIALYALLRSLKVVPGYTDDDRTASIAFLVISLPYIFMILLRMNWKIEIGKTAFTFWNIFRRKRVYNYNNVEMKFGSQGVKYYSNEKHIVTVSYLVDNWYDLENAINRNNQKKNVTYNSIHHNYKDKYRHKQHNTNKKRRK
ncbi:MAG: hypothetical protein LBQ40_01005 [Clostridiales bacterium]|jgi:hypothetical protein|nr:hypothetical protein [Clostridiales bacterium]